MHSAWKSKIGPLGGDVEDDTQEIVSSFGQGHCILCIGPPIDLSENLHLHGRRGRWMEYGWTEEASKNINTQN